ncbi:MAG: aminoglycoside phosphotransferase family protein [bacterium]|nr:aminoglycoside phosphotransferase family protein [bacterium]
MFANYAALIDTILRVYPNLDVKTVRYDDQGQNNLVLYVNERFVFRFPRYEAGRRQLQAEVVILRALQDSVSVSVPEPLFVHLKAPVGNAFMGYPTIPGKVADLDALLARCQPPVLDRLAGQLASFLKTLHTTPLEPLRPFPLPRYDRPYWEGMYERIRKGLFPLMTADAQRQAASHFEPVLADPDFFTLPMTLIHGDFGSGNLLYHDDLEKFTGVIDFGSAGIGDPAIDLAALSGYEGTGAAFVERIAHRYPGAETLLPRIPFYAGTFALQEALFGLEQGDEEALKAGLGLP